MTSQISFALDLGHWSTSHWVGGRLHGPDCIEGHLPQWSPVGQPHTHGVTQMPFECLSVPDSPRGCSFILMKRCNKFLVLSVTLTSILVKCPGSLQPLREPTDFRGAGPQVHIDLQHVDKRAFPHGKIASASLIAIESDKKSHTGQLLRETKMESRGRKNTRREQKIRGRCACALKNPEWWASLRHAGCSYHLCATWNQG